MSRSKTVEFTDDHLLGQCVSFSVTLRIKKVMVHGLEIKNITVFFPDGGKIENAEQYLLTSIVDSIYVRAIECLL